MLPDISQLSLDELYIHDKAVKERIRELELELEEKIVAWRIKKEVEINGSTCSYYDLDIPGLNKKYFNAYTYVYTKA